MKYLQASFFLFALATKSALAELTYTVTGTHRAKPIRASDIVFESKEPSLYRLNATIERQPNPKHRGNRRVKRTSPVIYSGNWCGAVQHSDSTNKITSVHAYFQVPTLSQRPGIATYPQYVATWVGIDGVTWGTALLQSGITAQLSSTGVQTNWAWFEWIPNAAYNIPSFPVAAGDWIDVTVSASSSTAGTIYINNQDQATAYTIPLINGAPLGRVDADWIVEDPATSSGFVPLAQFSETWFEDCSVSTANGTTKGIDGATMYYLSGSMCTSTEYDNNNFWAASA